MTLRKESKRGLVALAVVAALGAVTFAAVSSTVTLRGHARDAFASRLKQR